MGIRRTYTWTHRNRSLWYAHDWPDHTLQVRGLNHSISHHSELVNFVRFEPHASELSAFFRGVIARGRQHLALSGSGMLLPYLLSIVQHLEYYPERFEYPRYPSETLLDGGGDCEDTAILGAYVALSLGYRCALLLFRVGGFLGVGSSGHCDLGIAPRYDGEFRGRYWDGDDGRRYYYVACNGRGCPIGRYDGQWGDRASVLPI